MNLRLSLTRSKPEFYLQAAANVPGARVNITKAHWHVKRVQLTPAAENFNIEQISKNGLYIQLIEHYFISNRKSIKHNSV